MQHQDKRYNSSGRAATAAGEGAAGEGAAGEGDPKRVEEAGAESFPASDPPAWTSARAGAPEGDGEKAARHAEQPDAGARGEAISLYACAEDAEGAANALLEAGFAAVDLDRPRRMGRVLRTLHGATRVEAPMHEILFGAGLGALAAGFAAALGGASRARLLALLAAGGTLGALAGRRGAFSPESDGAGRISVVRVALNSVEDERLALLVAQECRAHGLYVRR